MLLVTGFSAVDRSRRSQLETFHETTAAGDSVYAQRPSRRDPLATPLATYEGRPLFPANRRQVSVSDSRMLRAARDEATGLTIYVPDEQAAAKMAADAIPGERPLFLKLAPGKYLRMRSAPGGSVTPR